MKALLVGLLVSAAPLLAQFQLLSLDGLSALPVPPVQNLGTVGRGDALTAKYRLRNTSTATAPLRVLDVAGSGFSLVTPLALPQNVAAGASVDFTVLFRAPFDGTYSAALRSEGVSVLITITVVGQLTVALETPAGATPLATGASVRFGSVERGTAGTVRLLVQNTTGRDDIVPPISVSGDDFSIATSPAGKVLKPFEEARLELRFSPTVSAARQGVLTVGTRSFVLTGIGTEPPLPAPALTVALPDSVRSGQQGAISVLLPRRSTTAAKGTVTLTLRPAIAGAVDPAVALSDGLRAMEFTVAPGDDRGYFGDQPSASFGTGSTAGVLVIAMKVGEFTEQREIELAEEAPTVSLVEGARTAAGVDIRITGFDNTRTAGPLAFTFYDRTGAAIQPGTIRADGGGAFGRFFQGSEAGGLFVLKASFPVTGDTSGIDAVEVEVTNSAGVGKGRAKF